MIPSKLRLVSVLLVVSLIVLGSSFTVMKEAQATIAMVGLTSRESNNATTNKGTITVESFTYSLPATIGTGASFQITYNPAQGYRFVQWEQVGGVMFDNPNSQSTKAHVGGDDYTIRAVYEVGAPSVGEVLLPGNIFTFLAPYLTLIGLIATTAAIAVKKRRN